MTSSSRGVRDHHDDPLNGSRVLKGQRASWKLVIGVLVLVPFLFALVLSQWLGTPREGIAEHEVFSLVGVAPVATLSHHNLVYGQILFARLELTGDDRTQFLRELSDFRVNRGVVDRPISFKLERSWWSPPPGEEGTYWDRGEATVWSPDIAPEIFYVVVLLEGKASGPSPREGDAATG